LCLFTADSDSSWAEAAEKQQIPIDFFVLNSDLAKYKAQDDRARKTWHLEQGDAILVRPDGDIALKIRSGERVACTEA